MDANPEISAPPLAAKSLLRWLGIAFGLTFPTVITWAYFVAAERYSSGAQQAIYLAVKSVQFAFPLIWVWLVLREPLRRGQLSPRGLILGIVFSVLVVAAGWCVYAAALRGTPMFAEAAAKIRTKTAGFGIDSTWKYAFLAGFYSLIHSLLEEYYWRWFVFGQLRRVTPLLPAIAISAAAFAAHHVVVLHAYFGGWTWAAVLLSTAVAIGGAFWAWLYERSGSLPAVWLSHLLIDAGVFWIGYDLLRGAF